MGSTFSPKTTTSFASLTAPSSATSKTSVSSDDDGQPRTQAVREVISLYPFDTVRNPQNTMDTTSDEEETMKKGPAPGASLCDRYYHTGKTVNVPVNLLYGLLTPHQILILTHMKYLPKKKD